MSDVIVGTVIEEYKEQAIPKEYNFIDETFRPVRCTESALQKNPPVNGYVYFTTDTKKIYYGINDKYLPMGGNSGIYYGNRYFSKEEQSRNEYNFDFSKKEIEGEMIPNIDDVILNLGTTIDEVGTEIADGGLYRVKKVNGNLIITNKLPIAGGGGGGSLVGPGGPSGTVTWYPAFELIGSDTSYERYFKFSDENMIIEFTSTYYEAIKDEYITRIEYYKNVDLGQASSSIEPFAVDTNWYKVGESIPFNLALYKNQIGTDGSISIKMYNKTGYSGYSPQITYHIINLSLSTTDKSIQEVNYGQNPSLTVIPIGTSTSIEKTYLEYNIISDENINNIKSDIINNLKANEKNTITLPFASWANGQHGVYTVELKYCVSFKNKKINDMKTDPLVYKIAYNDTNETSILIASLLPKKEVFQYYTLNIPFMVIDNQAKEKQSNIALYINEKELYDTKDFTLSSYDEFKVIFSELGDYRLRLKYNQYSYIDLGTITVKQYDKNDISSIDTQDGLLDVFLTSVGKNNASINKTDWSWTSNLDGVAYDRNIKCSFDNFSWGTMNGWIEDEEGNVALKLTNGAKLTIPNYSPFTYDAANINPTAEEKRGGVSGQGMTIELDFKLSGVLDYSKPLIYCLSKDNDDNISSGFNITGQEATFNTSDDKATSEDFNSIDDENENITEADKDKKMALQALTQYFGENQRVHLSYVIQPNEKQGYSYILTYLNGVLSGIAKEGINMTIRDHNDFPSLFTADSTYGDIYLYNIRIYRKALSHRSIIENYIADINDLEKKSQLYQTNNIYDDLGAIDKKVIHNAKIPYVLFSGGCKIPLDANDKALNYCEYTESDMKDKAFYKLPTTKKDFRLMSIKCYNGTGVEGEAPYFEVPIELTCDNDLYRYDEIKDYDKTRVDYYYYNNNDSQYYNITIESKSDFDEKINEYKNLYIRQNKIITDFKDIKSSTRYNINRGVRVYGQGTSSMIYPVKNLRLRFIQEGDFYRYDDRMQPLEIVCFKADFMESSSSHNTQTANLLYSLYANLGLRTPPQQFEEDNKNVQGIEHWNLVSAIRGFPIICFFENVDPNTNKPDGTYSYIGRYNFNIDKATPEPFGFSPKYFYTGEKVVDDLGRTRQVIKSVGLQTEEIQGKTVLPLDEENNEIKKDIVQCWEFLNNKETEPVQFLKPGEKKSMPYKDYLLEDNRWIEYYEDRYPDKLVKKFEKKTQTQKDEEQLDVFLSLSEWVNSTAVIPEEINITNAVLNSPVFYKTRDKKLIEGKQYYLSEDEEAIIEYYLSSSVTPIFKNSKNIGWSFDKEQLIEGIKNIKGITEDKDLNGFENSYYYNEKTNSWSDIENFEINLSDLGITILSGTIEDGDAFKIVIELSTNFKSSWYEKYTIDNKEYRLAKFYNEFNDHFDMNFTAFYYVVTLFLLMMDNRAKNMMLSTWDGVKWYPIFYDMDTMMGLNNTGYNKFSYDVEDEVDDKIYNGYNSVLWNNFKTCFFDEICSMYNKLRNNGLNISTLLSYYNTESADKWNEALITADAVYKYIRPFEEGYYDGKDNANIKPGFGKYLYAGQGRRSNHRQWWLNNRIKYLDSKYMPYSYGNEKPSAANTISFRAYALPSQQNSDKAQECIAQTPPNHKFDITSLISCYHSLFMGTTVYGPEYVEENDTVTLGDEGLKHEVESWILNPSLIADLGDLSDKYLGNLQFPSEKMNLKRLILGRSAYSDEGLSGEKPYDKYYNSLLSSLELGNSFPYLNELNVSRTGLTSLNLTGCNRLKKLYADGCTSLAAIDFPQDSILEELYLPQLKNNFILINQPNLTTIKFDGENGASGLMSLKIQNVPNANTYELVKGILHNKNTKELYCVGINWEITEKNNQVENDTLTSLDILEKIIKYGKAFPGEVKSQSFQGNVLIDIESNNKIKVDEFSIYQKYNSLFPRLNISYGQKMDVTEAPRLTFMTLPKEDSDNEIFYEVLTSSSGEDLDGNKIYVKDLLSENGPKGEALGTPIKAQTYDTTYKFTGDWIGNNGKKYTSIEEHVSNDCTYLFNDNLIIKESIIFYPIYEATLREFEVVLEDDNYETISFSVPYGTKNGENGLKIPYYRYKEDESSFTEYERYELIGWSTGSQIINLNELVITNNLTLKAVYERVNCRLVSTNKNCFEYAKVGNEDAYVISIADDYKTELKGKITLPATTPEGKKVVQIASNFFCVQSSLSSTGSLVYDKSLTSSITHVYFEEGSEYTTIESNAFYSGGKTNKLDSQSILKYVELPNGIVTIGSHAFGYNPKLETVILPNSVKEIGMTCFGYDNNLKHLTDSLNSLETKLPNSLETIGQSAFQYTSIYLTQLPDSLKDIGANAFASCENVKISSFGEGNSQLKSIGTSSFAKAGGGTGVGIEPAVINSIVFGPSLKTVLSKAFSEYSNNSIVELDIGIDLYNKIEDTLDEIFYIGFTANAQITHQQVGG